MEPGIQRAHSAPPQTTARVPPANWLETQTRQSKNVQLSPRQAARNHTQVAVVATTTLIGHPANRSRHPPCAAACPKNRSAPRNQSNQGRKISHHSTKSRLELQSQNLVNFLVARDYIFCLLYLCRVWMSAGKAFCE